MERDAFIVAFNRAAKSCRDFAQHFIAEDLPESLRFDFASSRRTPDENGRIKYLGGRLLIPTQLCGVDSVRARKYLWVDGRIPAWINLSVHAADTEHTYIEIMVCDRLAQDDEALYHQLEGNPPFHILGPPLPPNWVSIKVSGRFNLRRLGGNDDSG